MKSFEKKICAKNQEITTRKIYKSNRVINNNMIPSDPTGSLDEFFFLINDLNLKKF